MSWKNILWNEYFYRVIKNTWWLEQRCELDNSVGTNKYKTVEDSISNIMWKRFTVVSNVSRVTFVNCHAQNTLALYVMRFSDIYRAHFEKYLINRLEECFTYFKWTNHFIETTQKFDIWRDLSLSSN